MDRWLLSYVKRVPKSIRERGFCWTLGRGLELIGSRLLLRHRYNSPRWFQYPIYLEAIERTKELNKAFLSMSSRSPSSALWLIPDFEQTSQGGPNTLLRFAHFFASKGVDTIIAVADATIHRDANHLAKEVRKHFGFKHNVRFLIANKAEEMLNPDTLPEAEICFASLWTTAHYLLPYFRTKAKFYFIQDYESLFYPAGTLFKLADITYDFGYIGIFNTPGLKEAITKDHDIIGEYFIPGVDKNVFYSDDRNKTRSDTFNLFVYGRPGVPRNMYELVIDTVKLATARLKQLRVFVAGWPSYTDNLGDQVKFLGYLPYEKTGDLYRNCHAGIALMATPHPSYLPFQLMACGAIPVTVVNKYASWLLKPGFNCVEALPNPFNLADEIEKLVINDKLREKLREGALKTAQMFDWDVALERIWKYICVGSKEP